MSKKHHPTDPMMQPSQDGGALDLFNSRTPPSTQRVGESLARRLAPTRYRQIVELLSNRGPMAAWQIADGLGLPMHSVSGRITDLKKSCTIEETGERRTNPRSGVAGEVLRLTGPGGIDC